MNKINWGVVGTGWMAHDMGKVISDYKGSVYAVAGTSVEKALNYRKDIPTEKCYGDYHEMLKDENVDCVYIATPHSNHYQIMKDVLLAGKHVLCEKAITVTSDQLEECISIARERNLVICDGTTLLHMPLYKKLKATILEGVIGEIKLVQVNFGSVKEYTNASRFFDPNRAGGALLDIGIYAISFARYFLSSQPDTILTTVQFLDNGVDESSGILLKNRDGEIGVISLTLRAKQPKRGIITGTKGFIEIQEFPKADQAALTLISPTDKITAAGETTIISEGRRSDAFLYEIIDTENFINSPDRGAANLETVRDVMKIITNVKNQWGLKYPFE